jgi:hypothetical protein
MVWGWVLVALTALCLRFGSYNVLRVPLLLVVSTLITLDLVAYSCVRACVTLLERILLAGYKRRDRDLVRTTYNEWLAVGNALDRVEQLDAWKADPESRAYNFRQVLAVTRRLRETRERAACAPKHARAPIVELEAVLLPTLVKNYAGTMSAELFSKTHVGTKRAIEAFVGEVCACLTLLRAHCASSELAAQEGLAFWRQAQISFGNSALLLSGGAMVRARADNKRQSRPGRARPLAPSLADRPTLPTTSASRAQDARARSHPRSPTDPPCRPHRAYRWASTTMESCARSSNRCAQRRPAPMASRPACQPAWPCSHARTRARVRRAGVGAREMRRSPGQGKT